MSTGRWPPTAGSVCGWRQELEPGVEIGRRRAECQPPAGLGVELQQGGDLGRRPSAEAARSSGQSYPSKHLLPPVPVEVERLPAADQHRVAEAEQHPRLVEGGLKVAIVRRNPGSACGAGAGTGRRRRPAGGGGTGEVVQEYRAPTNRGWTGSQVMTSYGGPPSSR
jgi:hypothetical protein